MSEEKKQRLKEYKKKISQGKKVTILVCILLLLKTYY